MVHDMLRGRETAFNMEAFCTGGHGFEDHPHVILGNRINIIDIGPNIDIHHLLQSGS